MSDVIGKPMNPEFEPVDHIIMDAIVCEFFSNVVIHWLCFRFTLGTLISLEHYRGRTYSGRFFRFPYALSKSVVAFRRPSRRFKIYTGRQWIGLCRIGFWPILFFVDCIEDGIWVYLCSAGAYRVILWASCTYNVQYTPLQARQKIPLTIQ